MGRSAGSAEEPDRGLLAWTCALLLACAAAIRIAGLSAAPPEAPIAAALWLLAGAEAAAAVLVLALPRRLWPLAAGLVCLTGLGLWLLASGPGLPCGAGPWRLQVVGVPDLYLPTLEASAAALCLCLAARGLALGSGARRAVAWLPALILAVLLALVLLGWRRAQVVLAILVLDAAPQTSLVGLLLPMLVALLVIVAVGAVSPRWRGLMRGGWRTALGLVPLLALLDLVGWGGVVAASEGAWFSPVQPIAAVPGRPTTLAYCWPKAGPRAMDLTRPATAGPAPVVVYIHGGETMLGSRRFERSSLDDRYFADLLDRLRARGFAVASIDYGLAPLNPVGAQVQEAKCAIRFLRAHAAALGVDPARIGVMGPSQGGYIGAMVALAGPGSGYEVGQYLGQSSRVQAVVDMWGPADLTDFSGSPSWVGALVRGPRAGLAAASPVNHVAPGAPPFLIIQGLDDWFIAPHHSIGLAARLRRAGDPVELILVQGGGHGLAAPSRGKTQAPSPPQLSAAIFHFFVRRLG